MVKNIKRYLPIIGIEVHLELKTKSKMFCSCSANHFQKKPNSQTCPVCLGLPGSLPVINKKAVAMTYLIAKALNCKINNETVFSRKNYFYPDLAKGYQISQYELPIGENGWLFLKNQKVGLKEKKVKINRVHLEEDTAKLLHRQNLLTSRSKLKTEKFTLIDFNRSGVPLVEIVTEPDINTSVEAVEYLKKIQQIVRYLEISDADMEKGSMRCEVNISLFFNKNKSKKRGVKLPPYKVEIKNINSFKFVKKAIDYEIKRQLEIMRKGKIPLQETRGFNEKKQITFSQRLKEKAQDYRYFPDPDLPPLNLKNLGFNKLKIPELPDERISRLKKMYLLNENTASILATSRVRADYFEKAVEHIKEKNLIKEIVNLIVNKKVDLHKIKAENLVSFIKKRKVDVIRNTKRLDKIINLVLNENKKAILDYKKGKEGVVNYLLGQVMKKTQGKADVNLTREILITKIKNHLNE